MIATVAHWYHGVTVSELESVWAWGRVKAWHEHARTLEWRQVLPHFMLITDYRNVNRARNSAGVSVLDVTPEMYVPASIRKANVAASGAGNGNKWTPTVVASFTLLLKRGKASNALLNALHIADLKASGYQA